MALGPAVGERGPGWPRGHRPECVGSGLGGGSWAAPGCRRCEESS